MKTRVSSNHSRASIRRTGNNIALWDKMFRKETLRDIENRCSFWINQQVLSQNYFLTGLKIFNERSNINHKHWLSIIVDSSTYIDNSEHCRICMIWCLVSVVISCIHREIVLLGTGIFLIIVSKLLCITVERISSKTDRNNISPIVNHQFSIPSFSYTESLSLVFSPFRKMALSWKYMKMDCLCCRHQNDISSVKDSWLHCSRFPGIDDSSEKKQ